MEEEKKSGFFLAEMDLGKSIRLAHGEDILGSANSLRGEGGERGGIARIRK